MNPIQLPQNTLLTLCGIAGCGKSTFAKRLFLPTQIVSSDDCRARICDDDANQLVTSHAFELWRFMIRKRLLLRRFTVADATNLEAADRRWLTRTATYYNYYAAIVIFNLPYEICRERNLMRQRVVPEEALQRQYHYLQQTLQTINEELFDKVYIFNEAEQETTRLDIAPPPQQFFSALEEKTG